jgi:hypothetical protein
MALAAGKVRALVTAAVLAIAAAARANPIKWVPGMVSGFPAAVANRATAAAAVLAAAMGMDTGMDMTSKNPDYGAGTENCEGFGRGSGTGGGLVDGNSNRYLTPYNNGFGTDIGTGFAPYMVDTILSTPTIPGGLKIWV